MAYGKANAQTGNGLLSLIQNFTDKNKTTGAAGALSDREYNSFMDTDTGTEHHSAIQPRPVVQSQGAISDIEMDYFANQPKMDVKELQSQFARILGAISEEEQAQVINAFSRTDDDGKMNLMELIVSNPAMATGYGIQNEKAVTNLGIGY
jgi:hypothetical protein